jgi:hypothetical protein
MGHVRTEDVGSVRHVVISRAEKPTPCLGCGRCICRRTRLANPVRGRAQLPVLTMVCAYSRWLMRYCSRLPEPDRPCDRREPQITLGDLPWWVRSVWWRG